MWKQLWFYGLWFRLWRLWFIQGVPFRLWIQLLLFQRLLVVQYLHCGLWRVLRQLRGHAGSGGAGERWHDVRSRHFPEVDVCAVQVRQPDTRAVSVINSAALRTAVVSHAEQAPSPSARGSG